MAVLLLLFQIYVFCLLNLILFRKTVNNLGISLALSGVSLAAINSFLGLTVSYIWPNGTFNLKQILIVYFLFTIIASFLYFFQIHKAIYPITITDNRTNFYFFISVSAVLFLLLFFSSGPYMPIWGNVDEAAHVEMCHMMHERIFFSIENANISSRFMYSGTVVPFDNVRNSYIFGYHYIVALMAKITGIELIYITKFQRCLLLSLFVSLPLLLIKSNKKSVLPHILYCFVIYFTFSLWYALISYGFSAQLYSLVLMTIYIVIDEKTSTQTNNPYLEFLFKPLILFAAFNAYILTGILLLAYVSIRFIALKKYRRLLVSFLYCAYMLYMPPIRNQLIYFIFGEGQIDEAIIAGCSWGAPSKAFIGICLGLFIYDIYQFLKNKSLPDMGTIAVVAILGIYFFYDSDGYIMFKTIVTSIPILALKYINITSSVSNIILCGYEESTFRRFMPNFLLVLWTVLAIPAAQKICKYEDYSFLTSNGSRLSNAECSISHDFYSAIKYKSKYLDDQTSGYEYINFSGPELTHGYISNGKWFNSRIVTIGSSARFAQKKAANYDRAAQGILEQIKNNADLKRLYFIINHDSNSDNSVQATDFNEEFCEKYPEFIESTAFVNKIGDIEIYECLIKDNLICSRVSSDEIARNSGGKIYINAAARYSNAAMPASADEIIYEQKLDRAYQNASVYISGRSIHDSKIALRLYYKDCFLTEQPVEHFQGQIKISVDDIFTFDRMELVLKRGKISDAITLHNISVLGEDVEDAYQYSDITMDDLIETGGFTTKDTMFYGNIALPRTSDELVYEQQLDEVIDGRSIYIEGRSIHNSQIIIELLNNGNVIHRELAEHFEHSTKISLEGYSFDQVNLVMKRGNISDALLIRRCLIMGVISDLPYKYFIIDADDLREDEGFITRDTHRYGNAALLKDSTETVYTYDLGNVINGEYLEFSGRSIHNSQIFLDLKLNDKVVQRKKIEQFEYDTNIDLSGDSFDQIDFVMIRGNISDAIVVQRMMIVGT